MGRDSRSKGTVGRVTPTPARTLDESEIAQIHDDTKRMDVRDKIAYWDKRQARAAPDGTYPAGVICCPNDATHGRLTITGSGALLICGERRSGAFCTGSVPVSL